MTPELKALIEAARNHMDGDAPCQRVDAAYDAYQKSLVTPPEGLPEAPSGKKWVRVEYTEGGVLGDRSPQDCPRVAHGDYFWNFFGEWAPLDRSQHEGFARGRGFGWRLVDDPGADLLEKIAEEFERAAHAQSVLLNPAAYAGRIRKLIEQGETK